MGMTTSEQEKLANVLEQAIPSRSALAEMLKAQLGVDLDEISGPASEEWTALAVVQWADKNGKIGDLIRASQWWTPQGNELQELLRPLANSARKDAQAVPSRPPKISEALRRALVDALLLIQGIDDFQVRSELLIGIPWQANLPRDWIDVRSDLETMVDQLGVLGPLSSGAWPLVILADNARWHARDTDAKGPLDKVYKRLQTFYQTRSPQSAAEGLRP